MQQFRPFHLPSTQPWLGHSHTRIPSKPSTASSDRRDNSKDTFISISEVSRQPSTLAPGQPLHRFYFRSAVGVLGPIVVSAYFMIIWRIYLYPTTADGLGPLVFGPPGASYVFYGWFIAGVVGLNLSLYGLAGVEAAMLMEPAWNVGDAMTLMMHADRTWSGPGGWLKMVFWVVRGSRDGRRRKWPGRLWWVLAVPSMLIFAAWPLSGLCLETTQGWLYGGGVPGANVTGFLWTGFNERTWSDALHGARLMWENALDARIPGQGVAYTPEGYDRSRHAFLGKMPNILPNDEGVPEMFLTAQAETPIEGEAWGLLFQYNCTIVSSLSEMSIMKDRKSATENGILDSPAGAKQYWLQNNISSIIVYNQTDAQRMLWVTNLHAVIELGYRDWPGPGVLDKVYASNPRARNLSQTDCYFNKIGSPLLNYPGIDSPGIFEILLWQKMENTTWGLPEAQAQAPHFDFSIDHNLTSLYGEYDYTDFTYWEPRNATTPRQPMTAIGLTCSASSSVGTATLLGRKSSYKNFTRTDTPAPTQRSKCARRFDALTAPIILKNSFAPIDNETKAVQFLSSFFAASNAPPAYYAPWTTDSQSIDAATGYQLQLSFLQAKDLKRSVLAAYASYAAQLMYNGGQGWSGRDGAHNGAMSFNPNITTFSRGTVIRPGTLGVQVPLGLFVAWMVMSAGLCAVYGFRRRWSAVLDGHTLFRLGVGLKESHRRAILETSSAAGVETCMVLGNLPGLVGDAEAGEGVGRIGLVLEERAGKGRLYR